MKVTAKFAIAAFVMAFVATLAGSSHAAMSGEDFLRLCADGSAEEIKSAIEDGADATAGDEDGMTALHYATVNEDTEVFSVLAQGGADVNAKNGEGETPLMLAASVRQDEGEQGLSILLQLGANLEDKNNNGLTALLYAVNSNNVRNVLFLLQAGADATAVDNDGDGVDFYLSDSKPDDVDEDDWEAMKKALKSAASPAVVLGIDSKVEGLWLALPGFPKGAEEDLDINEKGGVTYIRTLDGGNVTVAMMRIPNPDGRMNPGNAAAFVARALGLDEGDMETNENEPDEDEETLMLRHPAAIVTYETESDGQTVQNAHFFLYPEGGFAFWIHLAMNKDGIDKYGDELERCLMETRFVNE